MHQLLHIPTLTLVTQPVEHWPAFRSVGDPAEWTAPPDHAYVEHLPRPDYDEATQTVERELTAETYGWAIRDLTEEELAARIPAPPEIIGVSKLTIMRRLGPKWATLKAILASLPDDVQEAWNLAQEIKSDDPLFVANSAFLQAALELTEEEFAALLTP